MYRYDLIDQRLVDERVAEFREQTRRYLAGTLSEDAFKPLRLQNGLYLQRHAPMLRVAIPYGQLSTRQLRALAGIARRYDRGYGHFSTRQNIQFNWPRVADVPEILAELAAVQMHAIQTSGNCIRNITTDPLAGVAADEIVDALPWCELLRQWSTFHPEFAYLPRKFKIAVSGARADRAAVFFHDIGLQAVRAAAGETGFRVIVGGGMGRTPIVGQVVREFLPWPHLLTYLEAILRVYNRHGRRDNIYKARIKILLRERGLAPLRAEIEGEWAHLRDGPATLIEGEVRRVAARFSRPDYAEAGKAAVPAGAASAGARDDAGGADAAGSGPGSFAAFARRNVHAHKVPGHAAVTVSLKRAGMPPGDVTADEMDALAALGERFGFGELRVTHEQNLLFPDVRQAELPALHAALRALGLARGNAGLLSNIIACPGGDFCGLANARSLPVAEALLQRFEDLDELHDIGELDLNISGCINSCGHHHVGHIGILGVEKNGEEWFQISLGGAQGATRPGACAAIGRIIGPAVRADAVVRSVERVIETYLAAREDESERFVDCVHRIGVEPFRTCIHDHAAAGRPDRIAA